ncbi:Fe-S cluster assembly protein HesB [Actinomadura harenae]|uniref:Fe-S cluster assembly protein HesB n=1 Tax=Actinomadura harenae TaxID=2483351 RepID=A0A3M2LRZ5_9ACTN|nr:Fe-S cluster assembly protein HesB [Actinomadura harenae]RMI40042.1 Fe-S cluster assembly protein HesB [Actinomadura harenae]
MLTLTSDAVQVIRTVTADPQLPPKSGIRIQAGIDGSETLKLSVAPAPEDGDEVVDEQGARVYLEPATAKMLEDMTLDATVDPKGDVAFTLTGPPTEV